MNEQMKKVGMEKEQIMITKEQWEQYQLFINEISNKVSQADTVADDSTEIADDDIVASGCELRKARFKQGEYLVRVNDISLKRNVISPYGMTNKIVIEFILFVPNGDGSVVEEKLIQSWYFSLFPTSQFYKVYRGILGEEPTHSMTFGMVKGYLLNAIATTSIVHNTDAKGNVYDNLTDFAVYRMADTGCF